MSKIDQYIQALEKLEKEPMNKSKILSNIGIVGSGAALGFFAAPTVAAGLGATTILGSSAVATALGGIFVTTTPLGWIIGTGVAGGYLLYSISKFVKSGAQNDLQKMQNIKVLKKEIEKERNQQKTTDEKIAKLAGIYAKLLKFELVSEEDIKTMLEQIQAGTINIDFAFEIANEILNAAINIDKNDIDKINSICSLSEKNREDIDIMLILLTLFKYMIHADSLEKEVEISVIKAFFENEYRMPWTDLEEFYNSIDIQQQDIETVCKNLKPYLSLKEVEYIIETLEKIAKVDSVYHSSEYQVCLTIKQNLR